MNEHLRISIDHLHEGVQVVSYDWRYLYVNETAAAHGRRTAGDLVGQRMQDCYPGIEKTEMFATLARVMDTRIPARLRNRFEYPNGEHRWFDLRIEPVPDGICVLSMDVTDEQETQERLGSVEQQLHQAQKMEAIGRLAGGIAHDFNNQLTAILGFAQLLLDQDIPPHMEGDLREIRAAAERSAALTRQLLAFSRRQVLRTEPLNLPDLVENVSGLLGRVLGEDITCEVRIDPRTEPILGDAGQLEHVLTNLAVNARDAMTSGGVLTLATTTVDLTEEDARQHPAMKSGRYSVLTVADTGHGMDGETQARIFDPFFTTKDPAKGTGLGLSIVYGVVKQMGGFIWVYSEVGKGTTFRLYFPVTGKQPHPAPALEPLTPLRASGGETILVVEDDGGVRELVVRTLRRNGYEVIEAPSAEDAWNVLREPSRPCDLALLDVVLPGQSGPEFLEELARRRVRAVFMSGYSEAHVQNRPLIEKFPLLEKPFTAEQLLRLVRTTLGADGLAGGR